MPRRNRAITCSEERSCHQWQWKIADNFEWCNLVKKTIVQVRGLYFFPRKLWRFKMFFFFSFFIIKSITVLKIEIFCLQRLLKTCCTILFAIELELQTLETDDEALGFLEFLESLKIHSKFKLKKVSKFLVAKRQSSVFKTIVRFFFTTFLHAWTI